MALIPRHEPDPNTSNPFALRYLWAFLLRNWLVWLLLVIVAALGFLTFRDDVAGIRKALRTEFLDSAIVAQPFTLANRPVTIPYLIYGPTPGPSPVLAFVDPVAPYTAGGFSTILLWAMEEERAIGGLEIRGPSSGYVADVGFAATPEGNRAFVSGTFYYDYRVTAKMDFVALMLASYLGLVELSGSNIAEVDLQTGEVLSTRPFPIAFAAKFMGADGKTVYGDSTSTLGDPAVAVYHTDAQKLERIPIAGNVLGLMEDGSVVASMAGGTGFLAYNPATRRARPISDFQPSTELRYPWQSVRWNQDHSLQIKSASFKAPNLAPNATPPHYWMVTPAGSQNDYHTSSTHPLAFVGSNLLLELMPDGVKIRQVEEVLKQERLRSYDPNDVFSR